MELLDIGAEDATTDFTDTEVLAMEVSMEPDVAFMEDMDLAVVMEPDVAFMEDMDLDVVMEPDVAFMEDMDLDVVMELAVAFMEDMDLDVVMELAVAFMEDMDLDLDVVWDVELTLTIPTMLVLFLASTNAILVGVQIAAFSRAMEIVT